MMKRKPLYVIMTILLGLSFLAMVTVAQENKPETVLPDAAAVAPVSSSFTYQGRLTDVGQPANGTYDLRFSLFDAAEAGAQVGSTLTKDDVAVSDGTFMVELDFGTGVFEGAARWLEIEVRPGASSGSYTLLSPRATLTAAPYALGLRPGAIVTTSELNVPAITVSAPNSNANALVATGTGDGYAVVFADDQSTAGGIGLFGNSMAGRGVYGASNADANSYLNNLNPGVYGFSDGDHGVGVIGEATDSYGLGVRAKGGYAGLYATGSFISVVADATDGYGVVATADTGLGAAVDANSGSTDAGARAVWAGMGSSNPGPSSSAIYARNSGTGASGIGVWGTQLGTGYGVYGYTPNGGSGIVGDNGGSNVSGYAGSFNGRVAVIGTLSKGGGSFKIDHPLDPANKYLSHSFVESPDMKNIYDGVVTLDGKGRATVTMPDWFEALNQEFRYQLTAIGTAMPNLYVAEKVTNNHFSIAGGQPGAEVSWQVTGIRHDPFAEANRIPVEEEKTGDERGHYLYPEVYGRAPGDSVWYASSPNASYIIDHPAGPQLAQPADVTGNQ